MTDTVDDRDDELGPGVRRWHYGPEVEQQHSDAGLWWLQPENVRYGKPEQLKERKASHTRRLRPMECDAFYDLVDIAKGLEKFRDKVAIVSAHSRGTTDRLRARRLKIVASLTGDEQE